jgi:carbonic anhydrase/acetyltransferase-like protein (isoleucine patch superfamily)
MAVYQLGDVRPECHESAWVAETASVIGNVIMSEGSSVWFGATVRGDNEPIKLGARSNIQDGAVCHSDPGSPLTIGEDVTIGHLAMVHGCTIGDGSLVGIGATILNGAVIGKNCLIGAHALVTEGKVILDNSVVMGSPGKVIKALSDEQAARVKMGATVYVANSKRFRDDLKRID